ncbi:MULTISPECIES: hypothetical protein [unclassified Nostoc]|uniref:hypothetical protein n=1 Tax=unclassified Nostoc TaxID=2593658 RepID=UPI000CF3208A|nr:hypothetical protein [Nostoc sp. 'Peltigera membranacea cyanobiont' N6]AVH66733.1 hypothetical protein NPM_5282 [Nostoc sp. 'Peltigera membranacea cyanobiont' N6]
MSIYTDNNLITNSVSASTEKYSPSGSKVFVDAYNNLSFQLTGVMIAATIMTSASTLPSQPISIGSAVSTNLGVQSLRRTRRSSQDAIATFSTELQTRSKSLSREDAQLLRKVILSKSQPGIPRF